MTRSFKLPDLGEGVHEGEVLAVHVSSGQQVKEGDIILEIETDKAAVEIPSPFSGRVSEVKVQPGDMVQVGEVLIVFDNGEDIGTQAVPVPKKRAAEKVAVDRAAPVPASPATRRLARQLGVDLHEVTPTGSGGVVSADDVRAFAQSKQVERPAEETAVETDAPAQAVTTALKPTFPLPDFSRWGSVSRIPFRSIRRATAKQMVTAWSQIPHVNSQDSIDITRLEAFRRKHKADIAAMGGRLTLTVFALKAVATALKTFPQFNASLDVAAQEIIVKDYYHIGVAVNTDHGLVVPVIRDVDRKSIKELSLELQQCVQRAKARSLTLEELLGGTFTITNAGAMGGGFFTPIINHPEVAILGMGQARMQPVVSEAQGQPEIVARFMMPVVLCIDHRVLDGADAIQFLNAIRDVLEDPDELLMTMT